ncbi:unnamed protein product [Ilex paraguariensis]|uniref:Uncharacterized protein n=1 Tax=Ilex paraguariensis TaxID=185542 RepID=A0ABC8U3W0_9AQUA
MDNELVYVAPRDDYLDAQTSEISIDDLMKEEEQRKSTRKENGQQVKEREKYEMEKGICPKLDMMLRWRKCPCESQGPSPKGKEKKSYGFRCH